MGPFIKLGIIAAALVVATLIVWMLVNIVRSDGRIEHCYVELHYGSQYAPPVYVVRGFRPWRTDIVVGVAPTSEEAEAKMKQLCPSR